MNHKQFWVAVGSYYRTTLPDVTVAMYAKDVEHVPVAKLMELFEVYRKDSRNKFAPMPGWFLEALNPASKIDPRMVAIELARKLDKAVKDHGSSWDEGYFGETANWWQAKGKVFYSFKEAAIEELGEIGYNLIQLRGGWRSFRQAANDMTEGTFIAQVRDEAMAMITNAKAGVDVTKLGMADQNKSKLEHEKISMLSSSIKHLEDRK